MPKDDDEEHLPDSGKKAKRVTFALNEIHHEIRDADGIEEETRRPLRKTVPSYVLGHPLADYDATDCEVSIVMSLYF